MRGCLWAGKQSSVAHIAGAFLHSSRGDGLPHRVLDRPLPLPGPRFIRGPGNTVDPKNHPTIKVPFHEIKLVTYLQHLTSSLITPTLLTGM